MPSHVSFHKINLHFWAYLTHVLVLPLSTPLACRPKRHGIKCFIGKESGNALPVHRDWFTWKSYCLIWMLCGDDLVLKLCFFSSSSFFGAFKKMHLNWSEKPSKILEINFHKWINNTFLKSDLKGVRCLSFSFIQEQSFIPKVSRYPQ